MYLIAIVQFCNYFIAQYYWICLCWQWCIDRAFLRISSQTVLDILDIPSICPIKVILWKENLQIFDISTSGSCLLWKNTFKGSYRAQYLQSDSFCLKQPKPFNVEKRK